MRVAVDGGVDNVIVDAVSSSYVYGLFFYVLNAI